MEIREEKTFDFNAILNWFGSFTPQFKNFLIAFRKKNDEAAFLAICSEVFRVFRTYLLEVSKLPKGARRAEWIHRQIDNELRVADSGNITCKKGCGFCCHFEKHISDDEAELIHEFAEHNSIQYNRTDLEQQAARYTAKKKWDSLVKDENRCVFLDAKNSCSIYEVRPAVCRKHRVVSPVSECEKGPEGTIHTDSQLMPEIITSAGMSLPDNRYGPMPVKLVEHRKVDC